MRRSEPAAACAMISSTADVQNENPDWPAYKKYFMHGTSHHIGLDTHDYGLLHEPMQANMVFTVEPGIYIPDEGFGIRLEDDVVIQNPLTQDEMELVKRTLECNHNRCFLDESVRKNSARSADFWGRCNFGREAAEPKNQVFWFGKNLIFDFLDFEEIL